MTEKDVAILMVIVVRLTRMKPWKLYLHIVLFFFGRSLEKIPGIDEANETTRLKSDFEKSKLYIFDFIYSSYYFLNKNVFVYFYLECRI